MASGELMQVFGGAVASIGQILIQVLQQQLHWQPVQASGNRASQPHKEVKGTWALVGEVDGHQQSSHARQSM